MGTRSVSLLLLFSSQAREAANGVLPIRTLDCEFLSSTNYAAQVCVMDAEGGIVYHSKINPAYIQGKANFSPLLKQ
jgi:hypothetical protein